MRIGFCGYATAGKDVAAQALVDERGFTKVNMSDAILRDMIILNPPIIGGTHLTTLLEMYSYDEIKAQFPVFRELLQRYGTDVWRTIDENVWVRRAIQTIREKNLTKVVTTGIRFPNEMTGIDYLVAVTRPGVGPVNDHVSDQGLEELIQHAHLHLVNDGSVGDLRAKMLVAYDRIGIA